MPVIWPDMIQPDELPTRLRVNPGTDEIAFGGNRFPVDAFGGNVVVLPANGRTSPWPPGPGSPWRNLRWLRSPWAP